MKPDFTNHTGDDYEREPQKMVTVPEELLMKCMVLYALGANSVYYGKKKPQIADEKRAKARAIEHEILEYLGVKKPSEQD